jgi:hypothetical protein
MMSVVAMQIIMLIAGMATSSLPKSQNVYGKY